MQMDKGSLEDAGLASQQSEPFTVDSCYAAGLDAIERGDVTKAQVWAERCSALPNSTNDARCAALQGRIAAAIGNFTEAEKHFRTAMRLSPREKGFTRQFVEFLQTAGRLNEAVELLEDLTRKDAPEADLLVDLGYVRLANGDRTGARKAMERAAALQPENRAILYSLAQMYAATGQPAQAAKILSEKFGEQASPRLLNELAGLLLHLERYDQAELTFRALGKRDATAELMVAHGIIWSRIRRSDWRGALDVALSATRLDRHGVTTQFLTYAKDRLFRQPPNASEREAELLLHLRDEMQEYTELHASEVIVG
jgi:Flp pilus assembly protein TadD